MRILSILVISIIFGQQNRPGEFLDVA